MPARWQPRVVLGLLGAWTLTGLTQKLLFQVHAARSGDVLRDRSRSRRGGAAGELAARPPRRADRSRSRSCGSEGRPARGKGEGKRDKGEVEAYKKKSRPGWARFFGIWSGKRDSNPRLRPWQGRTLPLSYSRPASARPLQEHGPTAVCEEVMVPQPRKRRQGEHSVVRGPKSVVRRPKACPDGRRIRLALALRRGRLSRRRKRSRTPRSQAPDRRASPSPRRTGTADRPRRSRAR